MFRLEPLTTSDIVVAYRETAIREVPFEILFGKAPLNGRQEARSYAFHPRAYW